MNNNTKKIITSLLTLSLIVGCGGNNESSNVNSHSHEHNHPNSSTVTGDHHHHSSSSIFGSSSTSTTNKDSTLSSLSSSTNSSTSSSSSSSSGSDNDPSNTRYTVTEEEWKNAFTLSDNLEIYMRQTYSRITNEGFIFEEGIVTNYYFDDEIYECENYDLVEQEFDKNEFNEMVKEQLGIEVNNDNIYEILELLKEEGMEIEVEDKGESWLISTKTLDSKYYCESLNNGLEYVYEYNESNKKYLKLLYCEDDISNNRVSDKLMFEELTYFILGDFSKATYNEETKTYQVVPHELMCPINLKLINGEFDSLICNTGPSAHDGTIMIEYKNRNNVSLSLPADVYSCEHNSGTSFEYSKNYHYTQCNLCGGVITYNEHDYGSEKCKDCDYYPTERVFLNIPGYCSTDLYYEKNTLTNEITYFNIYCTNSISEKGYTLYVSNSCDMFIKLYETREHTGNPCEYVNKYTYYFYSKETGQEIHDPISYEVKEKEHDMDYYNEEINECSYYSVSECDDCGYCKKTIRYSHDYEIQEIVSVGNINDYDSKAIVKCNDCNVENEFIFYVQYYGSMDMTHELYGHVIDEYGNYDYCELEYSSHVFNENNMCLLCEYEFQTINSDCECKFAIKYGYDNSIEGFMVENLELVESNDSKTIYKCADCNYTVEFTSASQEKDCVFTGQVVATIYDENNNYKTYYSYVSSFESHQFEIVGEIQKIGENNIYSGEIQCKNCKKKFEANFNLSHSSYYGHSVSGYYEVNNESKYFEFDFEEHKINDNNECIYCGYTIIDYTEHCDCNVLVKYNGEEIEDVSFQNYTYGYLGVGTYGYYCDDCGSVILEEEDTKLENCVLTATTTYIVYSGEGSLMGSVSKVEHSELHRYVVKDFDYNYTSSDDYCATLECEDCKVTTIITFDKEDSYYSKTQGHYIRVYNYDYYGPESFIYFIVDHYLEDDGTCKLCGYHVDNYNEDCDCNILFEYDENGNIVNIIFEGFTQKEDENGNTYYECEDCGLVVTLEYKSIENGCLIEYQTIYSVYDGIILLNKFVIREYQYSHSYEIESLDFEKEKATIKCESCGDMLVIDIDAYGYDEWDREHYIRDYSYGYFYFKDHYLDENNKCQVCEYNVIDYSEDCDCELLVTYDENGNITNIIFIGSSMNYYGCDNCGIRIECDDEYKIENCIRDYQHTYYFYKNNELVGTLVEHNFSLAHEFTLISYEENSNNNGMQYVGIIKCEECGETFTYYFRYDGVNSAGYHDFYGYYLNGDGSTYITIFDNNHKLDENNICSICDLKIKYYSDCDCYIIFDDEADDIYYYGFEYDSENDVYKCLKCGCYIVVKTENVSDGCLRDYQVIYELFNVNDKSLEKIITHNYSYNHNFILTDVSSEINSNGEYECVIACDSCGETHTAYIRDIYSGYDYLHEYHLYYYDENYNYHSMYIYGTFHFLDENNKCVYCDGYLVDYSEDCDCYIWVRYYDDSNEIKEIYFVNYDYSEENDRYECLNCNHYYVSDSQTVDATDCKKDYQTMYYFYIGDELIYTFIEHNYSYEHIYNVTSFLSEYELVVECSSCGESLNVIVEYFSGYYNDEKNGYYHVLEVSYEKDGGHYYSYIYVRDHNLDSDNYCCWCESEVVYLSDECSCHLLFMDGNLVGYCFEDSQNYDIDIIVGIEQLFISCDNCGAEGKVLFGENELTLNFYLNGELIYSYQ